MQAGGRCAPEDGVLGDGGACRRLSPEQTLPQNLGLSPCRTVALGVSFGLAACALGLVLGLCFADELLVSGEPPGVVAEEV